ncbi:hypothetical protein [Curtobacterium sp. VKM Ac-2887]|uniref:hypothetical protein n=1 Tax=Curtobacterium sp. VKM Ac-2887 TaxID=2783819 RepID=UPI00188D8437|nr:hypothetical protein [Curtobacterium sp. VKM Ac-2887]MBF4588315.1 hypothetical protein [Curtobacterium sp. VKM Ac-2887]
MSTSFRAFLDESSANRGDERQEYLVCAALVSSDDCEHVREQLRPLLLPGQIKFHWTDENDRRKHQIVQRIVELGPMSVVYSHLDARRKKTERYRRKTLESLYHELIGMEVFDLTLEARTPAQDANDRAHIVGLRNQGLDGQLHIEHLRGGDEPLLWIADAVLGAINAEHLGDDSFIAALRSTLVVQERTPDSLEL